MWQPAPMELGHAVLCAWPVVGTEPFAVLLSDDLMDVDTGRELVLGKMLVAYSHEGANIVAVQDDIPREEMRQFGIVRTHPYKVRLEQVDNIIEKPLPEQAPYTLGVVGRYVLNNRIFDHIERVEHLLTTWNN